MNLCRHHHILLWNIYEAEHVFYFSIQARDYKKLKPLAKKTGVIPHIEEKNGGPVYWKKFRLRITFFIASFLFLSTLYLLSSYVWSIEISGQSEYTKESLIKTLETIHVKTGMRREDLNCDEIETYLRKEYKNLSWVSAEEVGSRLKIKLKEGAKTITTDQEQPHHIVANADGVVDSIVTKSGTPQVRKGSRVKRGDVLIRGIVDVKDDAKEVVEKVPVAASGSVVVASELSYECTLNEKYEKKVYREEDFHIYRLEYGEHKVSLKNPIKGFDKSLKYDIIYKVCQKTPILITKMICIPYEYRTSVYSKKEAYDKCLNGFSEYLQELYGLGCKIRNKKGDFRKIDGGYRLSGKVNCLIPQNGTAAISVEEWSVNAQHGEDNTDS